MTIKITPTAMGVHVHGDNIDKRYTDTNEAQADLRRLGYEHVSNRVDDYGSVEWDIVREGDRCPKCKGVRLSPGRGCSLVCNANVKGGVA